MKISARFKTDLLGARSHADPLLCDSLSKIFDLSAVAGAERETKRGEQSTWSFCQVSLYASSFYLAAAIIPDKSAFAARIRQGSRLKNYARPERGR